MGRLAPEIEVIVLEGIDLEGSPPCDILTVLDGQPCGEPSVARIRIHCPVCQSDEDNFICQGCLDMLKRGELMCDTCGTIAESFQEI